MADRMRVKISGARSWLNVRITDMETGRLLPVTDLEISGDWRSGQISARVTLLIHEIELEDIETVSEDEVVKVSRSQGVEISKIPGVVVRDTSGRDLE